MAVRPYLIALGISLVVGVVLLVMLAFVLRPRLVPMRIVARLFPGSFRLAVRCYRDPTLPRGIRWRLRVAIAYVLLPINLIPNFIPLVGNLDTVVVLTWALRATVRLAGPEALERHWPGTPEGLTALCSMLRLPAPVAPPAVTLQ